MADPTEPTSYTNLLRVGGTWVTNTGTPGTVSVDAVTGQITIVANGTAEAYARRSVTTEVNKTYQLTWSNDTATIMFRMVGNSAGVGDVRAANVSVTGDNKLEFTATSTTTWIQFSRTTAATVTISSIILQEVPQSAASARRLNGKTQYFSLDAQTSGLRVSNFNWYIGGFVAFTYMPTAGVYLMDFGRLDPAVPSGGAARVRLFWDPDNNKISVSTAENTGVNYRENYIIRQLQVDTWYYIGVTALANADVLVRLGTQKGASYVGTAIPPTSTGEICRFLQLGARVANPRTSHAPCRYSNWVWASNWIPSDAQINELAAGKTPGEITGFTVPTGANLYHWPMVNATGNEASLISTTGPLVSNSAFGSIITVPGPLTGDQASAASTVPLDIIIT